MLTQVLPASNANILCSKGVFLQCQKPRQWYSSDLAQGLLSLRVMAEKMRAQRTLAILTLTGLLAVSLEARIIPGRRTFRCLG
jgi:hypothetical protein